MRRGGDRRQRLHRRRRRRASCDTNARIAANLGAPVVLAVKAKDRTPTEVAQVVELCLVEISGQHAHTAAVVANRCDPAQMAAVAEALKGFEPKSYVLPEEPLLVAPAVGDLAARRRGHASSAAIRSCSSAR